MNRFLNCLTLTVALLVYFFCIVTIAIAALALLALIGKWTGLNEKVYYYVTCFVFTYYAQSLFS